MKQKNNNKEYEAINNKSKIRSQNKEYKEMEIYIKRCYQSDKGIVKQ